MAYHRVKRRSFRGTGLNIPTRTPAANHVTRLKDAAVRGRRTNTCRGRGKPLFLLTIDSAEQSASPNQRGLPASPGPPKGPRAQRTSMPRGSGAFGVCGKARPAVRSPNCCTAPPKSRWTPPQSSLNHPTMNRRHFLLASAATAALAACASPPLASAVHAQAEHRADPRRRSRLRRPRRVRQRHDPHAEHRSPRR